MPTTDIRADCSFTSQRWPDRKTERLGGREIDDVRRERDQLSYLPHLHRDPVLLSRTLSNAKGYRSASLLSARVTCPHSSQMNLSVPAVCVSGISRAQSCSCRCAVIFLQLRHSFVTIRVVSLPGKKRRLPAMILLVRFRRSSSLSDCDRTARLLQNLILGTDRCRHFRVCKNGFSSISIFEVQQRPL